jgi:molybdenum cofactor guanylyltransferase
VSERVAGIFVGGKSTRMNGRPKGLLPSPEGRPIVERWLTLCEGLGLPCVLVGDATPYAALGVGSVADVRAGAGPLAGLVALMRARPAEHVLSLACDMPLVTATLLERLAFSEPDAAALAPRRDGLFEPLFARYDSARVLAAGERQLAGEDHSLQRLLKSVDARTLFMRDDEWPALADWDEPGDLPD